MPTKFCLTCRGRFTPPRGKPSPPRCPDCQNAKARQDTQTKRERRPYTAEERNRRAAAVAAWRAEHGDWCPGWRRDPHPSPDLTADHPHAVAAGGDEDQPLTILCRSCNGSKGKQSH
jgi:5-methylcytosine-specific restriction protein A